MLASLGTEVVEIDTVFDEDPVDSWLTLSGPTTCAPTPTCGAPSLGRVDPVLATVIDGAADTSALDLVRAEDACHPLNLRLVDLFHDVRLLVTPTWPPSHRPARSEAPD